MRRRRRRQPLSKRRRRRSVRRQLGRGIYKPFVPFVPKGGIHPYRRGNSQLGGNFLQDIWNATLGKLFS